MFNFCPQCGQQGSVKQLDTTNYECQKCGWHFWNNAKTAVGVAFVKDGQILVSKRGRKTDPSYGKYDLAGGFVNFNENSYDAAVREIDEEMGITLTRDDLELMDVYANQYAPHISTVDVVFLVRQWRWGKMPAARDDSVGFEWKPFSFLYDENFWQNYTGLDQKILQALEQGRK